MPNVKHPFVSLPACLFIFILVLNSVVLAQPDHTSHIQPKLVFRTAKILDIAGLQFKDLNRRGGLDYQKDFQY